MMSVVRRFAAVAGLVALLGAAGCGGGAPPSGAGATTPTAIATSVAPDTPVTPPTSPAPATQTAPATSAAPAIPPAPVPVFTGNLTSLLLPVPAGWQTLVTMGGPDNTLTAAELDRLYGNGFARFAGIRAAVMRQWTKGKVVITIGLFQLAEEKRTALLIDPRQYAGDPMMVEDGPVAQGVGGHYYVFKKSATARDGEPYAVVKTSRGTIVVDLSVSGGTVASVKADALALFQAQFAKIP